MIIEEIERAISSASLGQEPTFIYLGREQIMRLKRYLFESLARNYTKGTEYNGIEVVEVDKTSHLNVG